MGLVYHCRLSAVLQRTLPSHSQFPPQHLMPHSAYPKSKQPACPKCIRLGYGACIQYGIRALGAKYERFLVSLLARSYYQLSSLLPARLRFASFVYPQCLLHRVSGLPTTFSHTLVHCPRQRYHPQPLSAFVYPLSLGLAWPPSWRSCSVAQRSGQLASCGLTCGRKILDSMKIFDMQMPCHSLLLVRFQSSLPHALASLPC